MFDRGCDRDRGIGAGHDLRFDLHTIEADRRGRFHAGNHADLGGGGGGRGCAATQLMFGRDLNRQAAANAGAGGGANAGDADFRPNRGLCTGLKGRGDRDIAFRHGGDGVDTSTSAGAGAHAGCGGLGARFGVPIGTGFHGNAAHLGAGGSPASRTHADASQGRAGDGGAILGFILVLIAARGRCRTGRAAATDNDGQHGIVEINKTAICLLAHFWLLLSTSLRGTFDPLQASVWISSERVRKTARPSGLNR